MKMSISTKVRLKVVQKRLEARGVKDVKFTWAPNVKDFTPDQVAEDVIHVLEAYLDGNMVDALDIGDSVRNCSPIPIGDSHV
jgi:hypothetical protein